MSVILTITATRGYRLADVSTAVLFLDSEESSRCLQVASDLASIARPKSRIKLSLARHPAWRGESTGRPTREHKARVAAERDER